MMRTQVVLADGVEDSGAAPPLDDLQNEIRRLVDRHRATTIAQHLGQTLASQARIERALRKHNVRGVAAAPLVHDRVETAVRIRRRLCSSLSRARIAAWPPSCAHAGNSPAWIDVFDAVYG